MQEFRKWIRNQPIGIVPIDHPDYNEHFDEAPGNYIEDFCNYKKFSDKKSDEMFNWIALYNEVYIFFEEQKIRRKE